MPVIFYTHDEYKALNEKWANDNSRLAMALCREAAGFGCVNSTASSNDRLTYCDDCPARENCRQEFKSYSK